ncbi:MAG: hypothetical protein GTO63_33820 [Anaerolineae bacterium]|nr:hypothetical protein [Anaerolineae bacterium]NIQ82472.1 hypothetical protein [Anaerolineae bacterium]
MLRIEARGIMQPKHLRLLTEQPIPVVAKMVQFGNRLLPSHDQRRTLF